MATCEVCGDGFADDAEKTLVLPEPRLLLARVPRGLVAAIPIKAGLPYA